MQDTAETSIGPDLLRIVGGGNLSEPIGNPHLENSETFQMSLLLNAFGRSHQYAWPMTSHTI